MTNITWEDPTPSPENTRRYSKHDQIAAALKDKPGAWAKINEGAEHSRLYMYRSGGTRAYPKGEFEFEFRRDDQYGGADKGSIYARYIGA